MNLKQQLFLLDQGLNTLRKILIGLGALLFLMAISGSYIIYLQHMEIKTICDSYPVEMTKNIKEICKIYN